ncbi:hypothetical protein PYW07_008395 [Mythimna separata]|uniref:trypsin n=1 Tax=Mythimna separata TaxID=271217 RepID=A0AAD8DNP0_MYTSE|nr:hypothetical protein PYW07_008395 [Mythimna separata]
MFSTRVLLLLILVCCAYAHKKDKKAKKHRDHDVGIIGGHKISITDAPFIASVRLNGTVHWCGGSIIHERFILTAAHCIVPNREFKILVGTDKVNEGGKLYDVEKIIMHEKYSNTTSDYDVCLLKLNESLTFGPTVAKMLMTGDLVKVKTGMQLNVTGWGYTDLQARNVPKDLQQVTVPVVSTPLCKLYYSKQRRLTNRMMCAGGRGKDSCMGDSGGPLTWNNVQIGIVSFGAGCGVVPGVYTRIKVVKPWIEETIKQNSNEEKSRKILTSCAYGHNKVKKDKEQEGHNVGVVGGHTISIKQAPFMASLLVNGSVLRCGGSIIHSQFILTNAQCVEKISNIKVRVGTDMFEEGGKLYDVETKVIHARYSHETGDYDVAVLKLNESLTFGPTVSKVLLKGKGNRLKVEVGTMLNVTGWGYADPTIEKYSRHLQQVEVPLLSKSFCKKFIISHGMTERMMCAGNLGTDPCLGDSGGPLTLNNVQIGIITKKAGCGQYPSIFTRVRIVKKWIKRAIKIYEKREN